MIVYRIPNHGQNGNVLMLTMIAFATILFIAALFFTVYSLFFSQQNLNDREEKIALLAANTINNNDQIGQMNNMVALSRELVFSSRYAYEQTLAEYPQLEPFANRLLNQSRDGAKLVNVERMKLTSLIVNDLNKLITTRNKTIASNETAFLWFKIQQPQVTNLDVGYINNVDSNVDSPSGNSQLLGYDLQHNYIDTKTNLYLGNVAVSLPVPDNDLVFKISSLAPPVQGTISPVRLVSPLIFKSTTQLIDDGKPTLASCEFMPSALKMKSIVALQNSLDKHRNNYSLSVSVAAATNGASPLP